MRLRVLEICVRHMISPNATNMLTNFTDSCIAEEKQSLHFYIFFLFIENGIIKTDKVFEVMLATDRCHYAKYNPYMDSPQSIGKSILQK